MCPGVYLLATYIICRDKITERNNLEIKYVVINRRNFLLLLDMVFIYALFFINFTWLILD